MSRPAAERLLKQEDEKHLEDLSINPIFPVLCDFPFVGVTRYLDIYFLFSQKPMHFFHLGVSRMLKDSVGERLLCNTHTTDH